MFAENNARIMVAITFHYRRDRLEFLFETVRAIAHYPVQEVAFHIYTNSPDPGHHEDIREMLSEMTDESAVIAGCPRSLVIHTVRGLSDPQHLTWAHKPLVRSFLTSHYSHFIYTEDDHEITYTNFVYFSKYRSLLKNAGVYPGFQRTELHRGEMRLYSTDQFGTSQIEPRAKIEVDGLLFMTMDNPYFGCFILDQDLASEYVNNRVFDMEGSKESYGWEVCERSAMALTFENVPSGFWVRTVVPVTKNLRIASMACIRHLPNNYANNPQSPLGKIRMSEVVSS